MGVVESLQQRLAGRLGIMRDLRVILHSAGQPRLYNATALVARTERYSGTEADNETGAAGYTYHDAALAAMGEMVERYCLAYMDPTKLVYASERELGAEAVGMDRFQIHSEAEYARPGWPFPKPGLDSRFNWTEGESLVDGGRRYLPASLVYTPYPWKERSDFLTLSVSSGNAAHTDPARAILTGLYEVVERDAFMITWWRGLRLPRVDYMKDARLAAVHDRYYAGCGATMHIFDMTLDIGLPSYLCLVEAEQKRGTFVAMGAATRWSPRAAIEKAMLEAAQCLVWCRDVIRRRPDFKIEPGWANIRDFEDRVRLYCEPEMKQHVGFLLDTPRRADVPPEPEELTPAACVKACVDRVAAVGLEVMVVDQTAPDVAELELCAPKVMIPGTVPLTSVHVIPMCGSPRLWDAPRKCGYDDALPGFNPIPHLFP